MAAGSRPLRGRCLWCICPSLLCPAAWCCVCSSSRCPAGPAWGAVLRGVSAASACRARPADTQPLLSPPPHSPRSAAGQLCCKSVWRCAVSPVSAACLALCFVPLSPVSSAAPCAPCAPAGAGSECLSAPQRLSRTRGGNARGQHCCPVGHTHRRTGRTVARSPASHKHRKGVGQIADGLCVRRLHSRARPCPSCATQVPSTPYTAASGAAPSTEQHFETELEINDFPQHARWKVSGHCREDEQAH